MIFLPKKPLLLSTMAKYNDILNEDRQKRTPHYIYQIRTKFLAYFDTEKNRKKITF